MSRVELIMCETDKIHKMLIPSQMLSGELKKEEKRRSSGVHVSKGIGFYTELEEKYAECGTEEICFNHLEYQSSTVLYCTELSCKTVQF